MHLMIMGEKVVSKVWGEGIRKKMSAVSPVEAAMAFREATESGALRCGMERGDHGSLTTW